MTAPIRPASTKAYGREKWVFVPAIANINAMTVAEATGGTTFDLSCYFFDSFGRPTQNTARVTRERRVCDTVQYEQIGTTTQTGGDLLYAVNPQAVAATDGKKALEKLPEGTAGFLVKRVGIDVNTDLATGQFYSAYPIEVGPPFDTTVGDGDAMEAAITQTFAVTGPIAVIKAIVA